jgi:hypothetical protein
MRSLMAGVVGAGVVATGAAAQENCPIQWAETGATVALPTLTLWYGPGAQFLDANGDGLKDLVFASTPVKCRLGIGDGNFGPEISSDPNGWREGFCVGDLNSDGRDDFVAQDYSAGRARVMLSSGNGSFLQSQALSTGTYCSTCRLGDMDGDGDLDIVAGTELEGYLRIFRNNGQGVFGSEVTLGGAGQYHRAMQLVDLDRDGDLDIIVQNEWVNTTIRVFRNSGGLSFQQMTPLSYPGGTLSIAQMDVNRDGNTDLIASTSTGELRAYLASDTPFQFNLQSFGQISAGSCGLTVVDLNADDVPDLFLSDPSGRFGFALASSVGGLGSTTWTPVSEKDRFTLADIDGDGDLDVAAGMQTSASPGSLSFHTRICALPCPGDVTGNNTVDGIDLAALLAAWGGGKSQFDCDVDNDGIVGGSDLAAVLASWGACP